MALVSWPLRIQVRSVSFGTPSICWLYVIGYYLLSRILTLKAHLHGVNREHLSCQSSKTSLHKKRRKKKRSATKGHSAPDDTFGAPHTPKAVTYHGPTEMAHTPKAVTYHGPTEM